MSSAPDDPKKKIRLAVANAEPVKPRAKKGQSSEPRGGAGDTFYKVPDWLPEDAPVKALGTKGGMYFFLDSIGQLRALRAVDIGRLNIISLFGNEFYLKKTFPEVDKDGIPKNRWKHDVLGGILIDACTKKGLWDPLDKVRGRGTWVEEDGTLVMHCGDMLVIRGPGAETWERMGTGLRGSLLYPKEPRTLEPKASADGPDGPGAALLDMAMTWNWARGELDAKLFVGQIGCCLLGAAPDWRSQAWITGGRGTGKSTLQHLIRWLMGKNGMIHAENFTPAWVSQKVGGTSLPVSLDELEAKSDNRQVQEIIELMRIAASGGEKGRGGADGQPTQTHLQNCFIASSVLMAPLKSQDRSRLVILSLNKFTQEQLKEVSDFGEAIDEEADDDLVLGPRARWERVGAELKGRLLAEWPRYRKTFRSYRRALIEVAHDARGADEFGSLGAAFDCIMHEGFDGARSDAWAAALKPDALAETSEQLSEERECLAHLLQAMPDMFRGGTKETIAHWLFEARTEILEESTGEDGTKARRTIEKCGLRLYAPDQAKLRDWRLRRHMTKGVEERDVPFYLDVSHTASALKGFYSGTHWKGEAGAAGTWKQALQRLPEAIYGEDRKRRIDHVLHYVTTLPWETVFPEEEDKL